MEMGWSETGDRYLLKLFRDHLFHQVTNTGAPWVDMSHIVQCLNKVNHDLHFHVANWDLSFHFFFFFSAGRRSSGEDLFDVT